MITVGYTEEIEVAGGLLYTRRRLDRRGYGGFDLEKVMVCFIRIARKFRWEMDDEVVIHVG